MERDREGTAVENELNRIVGSLRTVQVWTALPDGHVDFSLNRHWSGDPRSDLKERLRHGLAECGPSRGPA